MSDPTLAAFTALREKLATPEQWTQGDSARTENGTAVDYDDPAAVSWCLSGAGSFVAERIPGDPAFVIEEQLALPDRGGVMSERADYLSLLPLERAYGDATAAVRKAVAQVDQATQATDLRTPLDQRALDLARVCTCGAGELALPLLRRSAELGQQSHRELQASHLAALHALDLQRAANRGFDRYLAEQRAASGIGKRREAAA